MRTTQRADSEEVVTRVDLHCHSSASAVSRLGVQRALGLPECATPPHEVYELAKRRGMDFVTITDHDTIDGALAIAELPDTFISEELTAGFHREPQAVHVLCFGITPTDHEWLQAHAGDVEACAEYLDTNGIVGALAHPFYSVGAPLTSRHRHRLAELFPIWETRNGSRARELNMPAAIYVEIPHYPGMALGVPSLPAAVEAIADGRYDLIHVCSPGPSGVAAALLARAMEIPLVGSYHTELAAYAGLRSGDPMLELTAQLVVAAFYAQCGLVLSPSAAADHALAELGIPAARIARWDRGVDTSRFDPALRDERLLPGELSVLYAGRVSKEKNIDLLADAFVLAHELDPRLHLVLAGGGPEQARLAARLGERASFLGWLEGAALAEVYASADAFCFPSETDTFGQVVLEAQASAIPVLAVDAGGPRELITDGVNGLLRPARAEALAEALRSLADSPALRQRLGRAARRSVRQRTWERALDRLAAGYRDALAAPSARARDAA